MRIHAPGPAIGAVVAALAALVAGQLTSTLGIVVSVGAAGATYVVFVFVLRALRPSEVGTMRRTLTGAST